jgi:hypothetical protein
MFSNLRPVQRTAKSSYAVLTGGQRWANNGRVPLEFWRLHDLLIGDAADTPRVYADPGPVTGHRLPAGQASDLPTWRDSLRRIQSLDPDRVHFCHHTDILHR